jgi:GT2 family glycosyltransferase
MNKPTFSFVVLSYNSAKYIHRCLSNIDTSIIETGCTAQIFVVENGSKDKSLDIINSINFSDLIELNVIVLKHNTGTTYSRNLALKKCTGEYIVIMDSDAYINAEALYVLKNYLDNNSDCCMAVPRILYPDGRYQMSTDCFPTLYRKFIRFLYLKEIEANQLIDKTVDVDYAISAFWMLPEKTIQTVGLLDEKIFYSPEDVDYCIRVWKSNLKITYINECSVIHDAQEISRPKGLKMINLFSVSHIKGLFYLYLKHKFIFSGKKFR